MALAARAHGALAAFVPPLRGGGASLPNDAQRHPIASALGLAGGLPPRPTKHLALGSLLDVAPEAPDAFGGLVRWASAARGMWGATSGRH